MGIFLIKSQIGVYTIATYVGLPLSMLVLAIDPAFWPRVAAATTLKGSKDLLHRANATNNRYGYWSFILRRVRAFIDAFRLWSLYASGILVAQLFSLG